MISRNLSRRLKRLEERILPAQESWSQQINFLSGDGRVTGTLVLGPNGTRTWTDWEDPNGPRTWTVSPQPTTAGARNRRGAGDTDED